MTAMNGGSNDGNAACAILCSAGCMAVYESIEGDNHLARRSRFDSRECDSRVFRTWTSTWMKRR